MSAQPVLFVSHGSPMLALVPGEAGPALTALGATLDAATLRAVVVMSPHWMAPGARVMTNPQPATWHDFGGFPEPLYRLQYPAPGAPEVAQAVLDRWSAAGVSVQADAERPFDHGAWMPLRFLLPQAQVPVVQVALPARASPQALYGLGAALADLREQGVLLVGSGSMTHNLHELFGGDRPEMEAPTAPYAHDFARWVESALQAQDMEALFDYRRQAPAAVRSHPTDEHFLPLFFALGAAGWGYPGGAQPDYFTREVQYGHLAMDSFALH
ncbi:dioxygenase family protein [Macromonas nakdongensis]|uniref:dioxygenase family protein n=1 Tax=Macromonas nakdongensis TaxID=1843082 RepID=UPI001E3EDC12|nr:class III extradiol ring-cleavage dioxygenase [Macromonas nakdongensis]